MVDEPVTRREFDRVVSEHERRLDGHDSLYAGLRETREELIRFCETLKNAREEMAEGVEHTTHCQELCASHRKAIGQRLDALEKFRWQITGALVLVTIIIPIILRYT